MRAVSSVLCALEMQNSVARNVVFEHTAQWRPQPSSLEIHTIKCSGNQQQVTVTACNSLRSVSRRMSST